MANPLTVARPYAVAVFESANEKGMMASWKHFLEVLALMMQSPLARDAFSNPKITMKEIINIVVSMMGALSIEQERFLRLLAKNKRFLIVAEINQLFQSYYEASQNRTTVRIVTAIKVDAAYEEKLKHALEKRIKSEVRLQLEVNPYILGGAVVYIDDRVIDGSVRGKLAQLLEFSLR